MGAPMLIGLREQEKIAKETDKDHTMRWEETG